jgi:ubiquinone/menaquinone biosynthesis C-methylase UbiE
MSFLRRRLSPAALTNTDMNDTSSRSDSDSDEDYRRSHLARGETYDQFLASTPFDAYMAQRERIFLNEAVPSLFPADRPRYLDFACGTGRITSAVAPLCADSVGVDISQSMLEQARVKCPGVRFVHADLTQDRSDLGDFDLVTAFRFFGNAQPSLREAALGAVRSILRPGGYLVINSHRNPHSVASLLHVATGVRERTDLHYFKLRSLLRRHGFSIVRVLPIGVWMYRARLQATASDSPRAEKFERLFRSPLFAPIAPDVVMVARKGQSPSFADR